MMKKAAYGGLLPPLSTDEFNALKADIKANGIRDAICVDEDGEILDGHHRFRCDKNVKRRVIRGLTEPEKVAFVFRANFARRNMSVDQRKEARKRMVAVAKQLREQDAKRYTQKVVAATLGVSQQTVAVWLGRDTSNTNTGNASILDARVKIPAKVKATITERVNIGESQQQVAADYGLSQQRVSQIHKAEKKQQVEKADRAKAIRKLGGKIKGIHFGDFRNLGKVIEDNSADLIFTDPPYDEQAIVLYADLAAFAARVLRPGAWCLCYSGQMHLPAILASMREHLIYGWMFAVVHTGGDQRIRNLKIRNGWKPILGFYKPPIKAWWDWLPDCISGHKEKDTYEQQQGLSEAKQFIDTLCPHKGVVVDCFLGGGTTAIACKALDRQFIGFEVDKERYDKALARIAK